MKSVGDQKSNSLWQYMESRADPFGETFKFYKDLQPGKGLVALTGGAEQGDGATEYFTHLRRSYDTMLEAANTANNPEVGTVKNIMIPVIASGPDLAKGLMFDADVPVMYEVGRLVEHANKVNGIGVHIWLVADTMRDR